jgi:hypothetical protein
MRRHHHIAAVALASAAAATSALILTAGGDAHPARTLALRNTGLDIHQVDLPPLISGPSSPESPGDELIATSRVKGSAKGKRYLFCAVAKQGASVETALYSCQVTYRLARGTIDAAGAGRVGGSKPVSMAVTGGSGAYSAASGTITSHSGKDSIRLK